MTVKSRLVPYRDGAVELEGYLAWDDSHAGPRPLVLIVHAYGGRSEFECRRADALAELGYVGFALDVYGKGVFAQEPAECERLMLPFVHDRRGLLNRRLELGLAAASAAPEVDASRVAAVGYCFGGLAVLDMARAGMPIAGAASFHGLFEPPPDQAPSRIDARILVLHGWEDPMVPPEQVIALATELTTRMADWQLHAYGSTYHAFTNPQADDVARGVKYDAAADRRSWQALCGFLEELFS